MTAAAALLALTGLLTLEEKAPVFDLYRVPDSTEACRAGALFEFTLARPARVRLTIGGGPARTAADGRPLPASFGAGTHRVYAAPPERRATRLASAPFVLEAEDGAGVRESADGLVRDEIANRSVAPVGHLFVGGVDLQDGHLLVRASDLTLAGRHLPLEASRTYSSAGPRRRAPQGAGWSGPYDGRLAVLEECGLFVVHTSDGGIPGLSTGRRRRSRPPARLSHAARPPGGRRLRLLRQGRPPPPVRRSRRARQPAAPAGARRGAARRPRRPDVRRARAADARGRMAPVGRRRADAAHGLCARRGRLAIATAGRVGPRLVGRVPPRPVRQPGLRHRS